MDIKQLRAGNLVTTNGKPAGTTKGGIYKVIDTAIGMASKVRCPNCELCSSYRELKEYHEPPK